MQIKKLKKKLGGVDTILGPINLISHRSPSGGYLGSCIDDERSKARKVV